MRIAMLVPVAAVGLMAWVMTPASAQELITGTASFRERIALPPNAVFEAVLEDISRADAPAVEIARTAIDGPGQPPIAYELVSLDVVEPLSVHLVLGGMFVYMADAARLTECLTGRSYPVAMQGDFIRLERAYLEARVSPGQAVMVTFEGSIEERPRMEGEGTEETAIVERFIHAWPGETCERNRADASLTNTYWRIVKLGDEVIRGTEGHREPHILLRANPPRFSATVGCNQILGGYETTGQTLRFQEPASTMMACPPPLDQFERRLIDILAKAATWRISGQVLELRDDDGKSVALLQAVYLR